MSETFDSFSWFDGSEMSPLTQTTWANYWRGIVPDGIVAGIGNEMNTFSNSTGLYVYVDTGECMIDNHRGVVQTMKTLPIVTPDTEYDRIDVVVARVVYGNENESTMVLDILTGTADLDPVKPGITQNTGGVYEIPLATVSVPANSTTITADDVTDARFIQSTSTVPMTNASPDTLSKGELVVLSTTVANAVERCPLGGIPIGVVASGSIASGAVGQIATVNGTVAEAKCSTEAVAVGDMLVADANFGTRIGVAGQATVDSWSHNAYGIGYALEAKEAGAVGNVKTLLGVMVKLRNANKWYLADGLTEENCIAAWKFYNTYSLEECLTPVNNSRTDKTLQIYGNVTKPGRWGLFFPAEADCYIDCGYQFQYWNTVACVFGFQDMATGSVVTAGTTRGIYGNSCASYLLAKGGANYKHCFNSDTSNQYMQQNGTIHANGVLACNWPTTAGATGGAMYYNGVKQSTSQATGSKATKNGWTEGRVFTTASSGTMGSMKLNALAFYNVNLTDAQHAQIYEQMNALGLAGD